MSVGRRGLEIRAASAVDAPGLCALLTASGFDAGATDMAARLGAMRAGAGAVLLAVEWGPPNGVVAVHWYETLVTAQPVAQIDLLLVGPEERRRGIGRLLVKAASQAARVAGCGSLELAAFVDTPDIAAFCLATGFAQAGERFSRALRKSAAL